MDESITGQKIEDESIESRDIKDGAIVREDINISSSTGSLITRIIAGSGVSLEYTGGMSGTGDVTISIEATSTGGVTPSQHRALDQLIHSIEENSYYDVTRVGGKVTSEVWWQTSAKLKKIRDISYTYSGSLVQTSVTRQYDSNGDVITGETYTETYNRTGVLVDSIDGVLS